MTPSSSVPCLIGGCNKSVAVKLELFLLELQITAQPGELMGYCNGTLQPPDL